MPGSRVVYNFDFGQKYEYVVLPAAEAALHAEATPGLYAWYLRLLKSSQPVSNMTAYDGVFATRKMDIEATGNLGEKFDGRLKRRKTDTQALTDYNDTLLAASTVFSPPIYIGISQNIQSRLGQHFRALETALQREPPEEETADLNDDEVDTDAESNVFGERIGRILRVQRMTNTRGLFVKILYQPQLNAPQLRVAERFVNRTFVPLCGRK